jgi:hypothetical protein
MVGALTPRACAASSRVRASLAVAGAFIAPAFTGSPLITWSLIRFVGLLAQCDQSLLTGDRSLLSTSANAQPLDYEMYKCESDRSQIGHFCAINGCLLLSAYPHANRIEEKELPFRTTTPTGIYSGRGFKQFQSGECMAPLWNCLRRTAFFGADSRKDYHIPFSRDGAKRNSLRHCHGMLVAEMPVNAHCQCAAFLVPKPTRHGGNVDA